MTARYVPATDVQVGDDLIYLGRPYRVTALDPYDTTRLLGEALPGAAIARSHDGWCMTLLPGQSVWIA